MNEGEPGSRLIEEKSDLIISPKLEDKKKALSYPFGDFTIFLIKNYQNNCFLVSFLYFIQPVIQPLLGLTSY
jgi:hypothetical protein